MSPAIMQSLMAPSSGWSKPAQVVPEFDPSQHLVGDLPAKKMAMKDLGLPEDIGVSPVAVSEPFQLFTTEAVDIMRKEVFNVPDQFKFQSNIAKCQLRGYAEYCAPFTWAAWNHPKTVELISKIAEVELVPVMPYEIAHINLSSKSKEDAERELKEYKAAKDRIRADEGIAGCREVVEKPIVGWHTDSYPFVCVLMMSDVRGMVGGETAVRKTNGEIIKMRGPIQGSAVIMQGRYITHQAMRALGAQERITAVTSFRPKSAFIKDDSVLRTVRGVSNLDDLYYEYANYRLQLLEEQLRHERERLQAARQAGEHIDTDQHKQFLERVSAFAERSNREIVHPNQVKKGYVTKVNLPDAVIEL